MDQIILGLKFKEVKKLNVLIYLKGCCRMWEGVTELQVVQSERRGDRITTGAVLSRS